jgi:hypothetical protein
LPDADSYDNKRRREGERQRRAARDAQDIAPLPPCLDPLGRADGDASFKTFCELNFPERFSLAWSRNHLQAIEQIEKVCSEGGLYALAMPRGSGKTTLCETAVLWATFTARRRFALLLGADRASSAKLLESIKSELERNELLLSRYPEIVYPIHQLEGITSRANGQKLHGERTLIGWKGNQIILPTVPGSPASGAVIAVRSILGAIRGLKIAGPAGQQLRPDLFLLDDPQTDASARSKKQTDSRIATITAVLRFLSGPGVRMSGLMPCTIIRRGDLAAQFLDRDQHPEWHGAITKLLDALPTRDAMDLWREYARIRDEDLRRGGDGSIATQFYAERRAAMDDGAIVTWPERFEPQQISGLQFAMDWLTARDPVASGAFWSEGQNAPIVDQQIGGAALEAELLPTRIIGLPDGRVPDWATHLTTAIDLQHNVFCFVVVAWGAGLRGHVVRYGTLPDQQTEHFAARYPPRPLVDEFPGLAVDRRIAAGLLAYAEPLRTATFAKADGSRLAIARMLLDAADGHATDAVLEFADDGQRAANTLGARGVGIGPGKRPLREWQFPDGSHVGLDWAVSKMRGRLNRHLQFDSNLWKTRVARGLTTAPDEPGAITICGDATSDRRGLFTHLLAERPDRQTSAETGRTLDVWSLVGAATENHWWDCLVMAAVAASTLGLEPGAGSTASAHPTPPPPRSRFEPL